MNRRAQIKAYVTTEEKNEISGLAKQARVTVSELVRRLVTGRSLPDSRRHEAVIELVKINADLARLGNLLRMALDNKDFRPPEGYTLETLFASIRGTQETLKSKIEEL